VVLRLPVVVLAVAATGLGVGSTRDRQTAIAGVAVATMNCVAAGPATAKVVDRPIVGAAAVASARRYARSRLGSVSFAVVEDHTPVRGYRRTAGYPSASVIKAMVMVAVLRRAGHRRLTSAQRVLLDPMITRSDNAAAIALWNELGADELRRLAAAAGMRRFSIGAHLFEARIDASDQARFFLVIDRLVPAEHRAYARRLLASIVSWQRWGIADAAERHGFRVSFKGGWRPAITHQVALLRRDGRRLAIAVLTAGGPSIDYGEQTIEGIADRLLRRAR
jgi:Beta-lactamase enzyme family